MKEIWKKVDWSPGHEVSSLGNVRSLDRAVLCKHGWEINVKGRNLKPIWATGNYRCVSLINGMVKIHRVVAIAFIPNPENKREVNHINGIKTDNRAVNLEWVTRSENIQHAFRTGLNKNQGETHYKGKLTESNVISIRQAFVKGESNKSIADRFGVTSTAINKIRKGLSWKRK